MFMVHFKKRKRKRFAKDLTNDAYMMFVCVFFFLIPIFFIKAYVVGTHLNCIDKYLQHMPLKSRQKSL